MGVMIGPLSPLTLHMLDVFHSQALRKQRPTMQVHHLHTTKNLLEHSEASLRSLSKVFYFYTENRVLPRTSGPRWCLRRALV